MSDARVADVIARSLALAGVRHVFAYPGETIVDTRVLELAGVYGGPAPVAIPLIQEELAALAGVSRATVNRVLREAELAA